MINQDIAKIFREMAVLLEMQEVAFKPRAYNRAAQDIENFSEDLREIYKKGGLKSLEEIPGVGQGIAERIEEYIKTRRVKDYERLKKKIPIKIDELTSVEGIGPKAVYKLYKELGIKNLSQLEKAAKDGKIGRLNGFGKKSEEKILQGIEFVKKHRGRHILGFILPTIRGILAELDKNPNTEKVVVAGSVRRMQETIGDVDILITSKKPEAVMAVFVALPEVARVVAKGATKSAVKLKNGLDPVRNIVSNGVEVDLRVVAPESFGAALQYFTGSKEHNIKLREIASGKGYKLNEYGLFKGKKMVAGKTEGEIYEKLGMSYIEPELRTLNGEIESAQKHKLPKLINYGNLKGDLHTHTNWTDGENSIEEMAEAARAAGLEYIVITDHTKSLAMTGGADEKKLLKQMAAIDEINLGFKNLKFKILKGAEVNIGKDGSLDIADEILAKLDVVGAAAHSHFNLPQAEQTGRIIRAMENPHVDIIFHPTGRILNRREAIELDIDEIIRAAKRTGTVLEIDAFPDRLDLKDEYVRKCVESGVKLAIDSDAHSAKHFAMLEFGIAQARRGWATKNDIINAWPMEKMLGFLKVKNIAQIR